MNTFQVPVPDRKTIFELHRLYMVLNYKEKHLPEYVNLREVDSHLHLNRDLLVNYGHRVIGTEDEINKFVTTHPEFILYVRPGVQDQAYVDVFNSFVYKVQDYDDMGYPVSKGINKKIVRSNQVKPHNNRFLTYPVLGYREYGYEITTEYLQPDLWSRFIELCMSSEYFSTRRTQIRHDTARIHNIESSQYQDELAALDKYLVAYGSEDKFWQIPEDDDYYQGPVTEAMEWARRVVRTGDTSDYARILNMINNLTTPLHIWQVEMVLAKLEDIMQIRNRNYYSKTVFPKFIELEHLWFSTSISIERDLWNSLPPSMKKAVVQYELGNAPMAILDENSGVYYERILYIKKMARQMRGSLPPLVERDEELDYMVRKLSDRMTEPIIFDDSYTTMSSKYPPNKETSDITGLTTTCRTDKPCRPLDGHLATLKDKYDTETGVVIQRPQLRKFTLPKRTGAETTRSVVVDRAETTRSVMVDRAETTRSVVVDRAETTRLDPRFDPSSSQYDPDVESDEETTVVYEPRMDPSSSQYDPTYQPTSRLSDQMDRAYPARNTMIVRRTLPTPLPVVRVLPPSRDEEEKTPDFIPTDEVLFMEFVNKELAGYEDLQSDALLWLTSDNRDVADFVQQAEELRRQKKSKRSTRPSTGLPPMKPGAGGSGLREVLPGQRPSNSGQKFVPITRVGRK